MQAPPVFQISVRRFGLWQAGLGLLAGGVLLALGGWAWTAQGDAWVLSIALLLALASGLGVVTCARVPPFALRWDTQRWWLVQLALPAEAGQLQVAIDLGPWMLLRFSPEGVPATRPWRQRWLPIQCQGQLPGQWHALRCTVFMAAIRRSA